MGCTDITSPGVPEAWIPGNYGDYLEKGLVESQTLTAHNTEICQTGRCHRVLGLFCGQYQIPNTMLSY